MSAILKLVKQSGNSIYTSSQSESSAPILKVETNIPNVTFTGKKLVWVVRGRRNVSEANLLLREILRRRIRVQVKTLKTRYLLSLHSRWFVSWFWSENHHSLIHLGKFYFLLAPVSNELVFSPIVVVTILTWKRHQLILSNYCKLSSLFHLGKYLNI